MNRDKLKERIKEVIERVENETYSIYKKLDEFTEDLKYITARFTEAKVPSYDYLIDIEGEDYMYITWNQEKGKITCVIQEEEHVLAGMNKETRLLLMDYLEDFLVKGAKRDDR